ncbi:catalase family protein [Paucibacter sp. APW11]|uniref:Catalase family protein n=1 Tax=Roseateles aquae TaxID=3077235 RepID=A0ABU3PAM2_9BURK|nr:catalase family protein [Paucibacter sp. APW11]MDT8999575.1 catalase family protein [Paucibacter sp. APW11]
MSDSKLSALESPPANEAQCINDLAARLQAKIVRDNAGGPMRRDAHPKMHGLVRAEFIVEPDLPEELRIGVFAEPGKTYPAWIRFSNQDGTIQPDINADIRGMAIKLMGVPGDKLLEAERQERTQDFIVISTPVFVTRDVEEFDDLIKALTGSLWAKLCFFLTHWHVAGNLLRSMKKHANPLQLRYWSTTPYLLGTRAVKYSAIPRAPATDTIPDSPGDDYLREAMVRQLARKEVVYDFAVQLQTDAAAMPIEDPSIEWPEALSTFRKVAAIRIPAQQFDSPAQRVFGENLSFTPWHSLPEHRPLGGINRARKIVYAAISTFRHAQNGVPRREPVDWTI